ncbi:MAG: RNA chaperone Hfq [Gammaproteobacteria bacterium]|nr:RNA chaperone Hfq [Gammaproteobacteria bacterium]
MANLQDTFLADLSKSGEQVAVFLINGIKLHGVIDTFDEEVIFLKNAITQMVFKHAVSTVVPATQHKTPHNNHD